mgnify:CR=1 FL=1
MKCEIRFCSLFFGEDDFSGGMSGLTFVLMIKVLPFMVVTFGFVVMSLCRMVVIVVRLTRFVRLMVVRVLWSLLSGAARARRRLMLSIFCSSLVSIVNGTYTITPVKLCKIVQLPVGRVYNTRL